MPRRLLKKICPSPGSLQKYWFLRLFGDRLADPRLWTVHRRGVTSAFGIGLAICFIPLPVHSVAAAIAAIGLRLNLPAIYGATLLLNPFTCVPAYYTAYRVGTTLMDIAPEPFHFQPSLLWLHTYLQPVWKPFLLGCTVCAVVTGVLGWLALEVVWRWRVTTRYRARHLASAT